jgi:SAM-dependent methyltransferase
VVQAFFIAHDVDRAFETVRDGDFDLPDEFVSDERMVRARDAIAAGQARVNIGMRMFAVVSMGNGESDDEQLAIDLRGVAARHVGLLAWLMSADLPASSLSALDRATFDLTIAELSRDGLLAPPPARLGEQLPRRPLCQMFGMQRGTPIDRYYLLQFIKEAVTGGLNAGRVLDVGGTLADRIAYRLRGVSSYDALDLEARHGVSIVGNAEEQHVVAPESIDTALLFNVLEHSQSPQLLVDNVRQWLAPGGSCLAMVPAAQRLHDFPVDWGRFSPRSFAALFSDFQHARLYVYGNLAGLAAEEFEPETLNEYLPDYPVAIAIHAVR